MEERMKRWWQRKRWRSEFYSWLRPTVHLLQFIDPKSGKTACALIYRASWWRVNTAKQRLGATRPLVGGPCVGQRLLNPLLTLHSFKMFGPLGPSLAPAIKANRGLYKWLKPIANWYAGVSGYRRVGLKYDDLRTCNSCDERWTPS